MKGLQQTYSFELNYKNEQTLRVLETIENEQTLKVLETIENEQTLKVLETLRVLLILTFKSKFI